MLIHTYLPYVTCMSGVHLSKMQCFYLNKMDLFCCKALKKESRIILHFHYITSLIICFKGTFQAPEK